MSVWYDPKKEDLSLSKDMAELHAYLYSDEFGAVYASLKVDDIKDILKNI